MKYSFLLMFFFLITRMASAQHSVVFPYQNNSLVKGFPNWLTIGLQGVAADSIEVTAHHSKIEKKSTWDWWITPDTGYGSETIIVTAWNKNKLVSKDSSIFRLKWLPDPKIYVANKSGTKDSIQRSSLAGTAGVYARGENIDQDAPYYVKSFRMTIDNGVSTKSYVADGPYITPEMKQAIMEAHPRDKAVFDEIVVRYPDGRIRTVQGVTLLLK